MTSEKDLQEALANCDRDPIHIPGAIQSFGALVALDQKLERIEFASENTSTFLGIEAASLLNESVSILLDREESHQARNCLTHRSIVDQREVIGEKVIGGRTVQMSIHLKDDRSIIEFVPIRAAGVGEPGALARTRALLAESVAVKDYQSTLDASVESLRASTGYDRVKAYRFLPNNSGEVVAESRSASMDSFLGLRFPASDIPPIARKLYQTTPIRVIADVEAIDTPIIGSDSKARPLDLSLAVLRGTADVHLRYIKNMGIRSTLTLPIIVEGELWGMFALHHMKPRLPDPTMLIAAELSGKMLSLIIQHTTQTRHQVYLNSCTGIANDLLDTDSSKLSEDNFWDRHKDRFVEAIPSDGIAYVVGRQVERSGQAPNTDACLAVIDLFLESAKTIVSFDDLQAQLPEHELGSVGGAMILSLSADEEISLIIFRNLAVQNIDWAGSPKKELTKSDGGLELNPRSSFAQYTETIKGKSDEWTNENLEIATVLQSALVRSLNVQTERKDTQHRMRLMIRELNHRVRNILTLVQSLSSSAKSSATSIEGYATALEQRIVALAGAHDLLTREDMRGIQLDKIAALELRPYLDRAGEASSISGPDVMLNADVSPIIALVFHELTSNSVKYGALSQPSGTVALSWEFSEGNLEIHWVEQGGPAVSKPIREGFGRSIIENAIPYEFGGKAEIIFATAGVQANFTLPKSEFGTTERNSAEVETAKTTSNQALKRGLVVEDNFVIAREARLWLEELGFQETIAVASVKGALSHLADGHFDFCLLDVNLRGEMSEPIAKKLTELGIPYVFASGYGSEGSELCNHYDVPFLTKPINIENLRKVLVDLDLGE